MKPLKLILWALLTVLSTAAFLISTDVHVVIVCFTLSLIGGFGLGYTTASKT